MQWLCVADGDSISLRRAQLSRGLLEFKGVSLRCVVIAILYAVQIPLSRCVVPTVMIFHSSDGGMFSSVRDSAGSPWSEPVQIIQGPAAQPWLSLDGNCLYYRVHRAEQDRSELWMIRRIPAPVGIDGTSHKGVTGIPAGQSR